MNVLRLRSIQRGVGGVMAVVVVTLIANSLFLLFDVDATRYVGFMQQLHIWLGLGLCVIVVGFVWPHFLIHRRHLNKRARNLGFALVAVVTVGCVAGIALLIIGKSSAVQWLVWLHIASFLVGLLGYIAHRLAAYATPVLWYEIAGGGAVALLLAGFWLTSTSPVLEDEAPPKPLIADVPDQFLLSRAVTDDGHWLSDDDLANPQYCAQCHEQIAAQWDGSAHHFSSFNNPFYAATFNFVQQSNPARSMKFCGGCHDPLILNTGNMNVLPISEDTTNAKQGLTCLACHAIVEVPDRIGNGGYVLAKPEHYPYYDSDDPDEQEINRRLIRSKPQQHKASFMKPFMRESEFCLACHKAHLPQELNSYKWKRGQNDFDAWQMSAASLESGLTFYNAPARKTCQACHMPDVPSNDPAAKDGLARDHTFPGANTALAMIKDKPDWLRKTQDLLKGCASVDIFSAVVRDEAGGRTRVWPLEDPAVQLPASKTVMVEVGVRNRKVAHLFPGGTIDLNEPWLEFEVRVTNDRTLYHSGWLDPTGRLDPYAHRYNNMLLTRDGRYVDVHQVEEFYTVLYNNAIPLGPTDIVRYEFEMPDLPSGSKVEIVATLNHRKFSREYTEFALGPDAPPLPITVIDRDAVTVTIGETLSPANAESTRELALRVNDFGIGQLRQGNTQDARWAFEQVTQMLEDDADAWVNLARVQLSDGKLDQVERVLREADRIRPGYHKTAFFLGQLRAAQGRHEEAVAAYDLALEAFPRDRRMLIAKTEALYRLERFTEAVDVAMDALAVDPENVAAHTYLARAHRALGNDALADEHLVSEAAYRPQREEERATRAFRRKHAPGDLEANAQHIHRLNPHDPERATARRDAGEVDMFPTLAEKPSN